jgi:hypothetical protein
MDADHVIAGTGRPEELKLRMERFVGDGEIGVNANR